MHTRTLFAACLLGVAWAQPDAGVRAPADAGADLAVAAAPASPNAATTARLRAAYDAIGGLEQVTIDVQADVVLLRGTVTVPAARRVAEEIANRLAAPLYVANGIEVVVKEDDDAAPDPGLTADERDQALQGQLRSILSTVSSLSAVKVRVASGIVHLTGQTRDEDAVKHAVELARKLEGVLFVDNGVEIVTTVQGQLSDTWRDVRGKAIDLVGALPVIGIGLIVFFLALWLGRVVRHSRPVGRLFSKNALLQTVALRILSTGIAIAGIMLALDLMDATGVVGALLGTAGIVGLAVGFAFKDIVENYLAGILLAVSRPFEPKDAVKIGEWEGKIIRLSARETVLMTYDGNHVQIPNAQVFGSAVMNFSRNPRRRFDFVIGVGNGEDLARAQRVAVEALQAMPGVMDDPAPHTRVEGFGDSSMALRIFGWVDQADHDFAKVKSEAIRTMKRAMEEAEVDLPNPISIVQLEQLEPRRSEPPQGESEEPAHDLSVDREIESQIDEDPAAQKDLLDP